MALPKERDPKRIGGSDVAAICGISDYASPIQVWCRLTGRDVPGYSEPNEAMTWGIRLEPAILQSLADDIKFSFERGVVLNHPSRQYCISPDGFKLEKQFYAEVKNLAWFKRQNYGEEGSDEIDKQYLMQVQHGLGIFQEIGYDITTCHFRALFGGQRRSDFFVHYEKSLVDPMWNILENFLDEHVKKDIPPEPENTAAYYEYLTHEYHIAGELVEKVYLDSNPDIDRRLLRYEQIGRELRLLGQEKDQLKNELCSYIGSNYGIQSPFGKFIWYPVSGRVNDSGVVTEIMSKYNIPKNDFKAIQENNRGEDFRVNRFYPSKELKDMLGGEE